MASMLLLPEIESGTEARLLPRGELGGGRGDRGCRGGLPLLPRLLPRGEVVGELFRTSARQR